MSSPKEPGYPRPGDAANGSAAGPGQDGGSRAPQTADAGDPPPWQRGPAGRARQQAPEGAHPDAPRAGTQAGLDARLNRFIAGGAAPTGGQDTEAQARNDRTEVIRPEQAPRPDVSRSDQAARPEVPRPEPNRPEPGVRPDQGAAYASEIPDLSGGLPRQQRRPAERPTEQQPKPPVKSTPAPGNRAVQAGTRQQHRGPVRASMQIRRVDPWSTLKVSLLLSVVLFFVWMIAVAFLYLVLGGMGVWSKLNSNVGDLLTSASGSSGGELVSSGTIFGGAALIGLVNIVLMTAAATIGAFIYNLTTDLVGGVEVTLADRD
ncbi:DUF3566 domain-containing protein [Mycobacterium sp. ZZG]